MAGIESLNSVLIVIAFIIPGFLAGWVFTLKIPRSQREFSIVVLESLMFSCFIYGIIIPFYLIGHEIITKSNPRIFASSFLVLLVIPILVGYGFASLLQSPWGEKTFMYLGIKSPMRKAWDHVFSARHKEQFLILVTLNDDTVIGGVWHKGSFASTNPEGEDLFLSVQYELDENGGFIGEIPLTKGCWINADHIKYIEMFEIQPKEAGNEQQTN